MRKDEVYGNGPRYTDCRIGKGQERAAC